MNISSVTALSADYDVARRIAFVRASVANRFGLPPNASPEMLMQCAMERPEQVTPQEFKLIYAMRSTETISPSPSIPDPQAGE
jgi:hypothetical protein